MVNLVRTLEHVPTLMKLLFGGPFHHSLSGALALRGAAKLLLKGSGRVGVGHGAETWCEGRRNDEFGKANNEWRRGMVISGPFGGGGGCRRRDS